MKFKSNIEVQAGIEDKDGQVGSSGQILASTGSQVDWIDPANIVTSATDVIIECKNTSGVTIAKGTPVYQTGNVGATAVIEIAVADASDEDKMAAIGLLQSDLINNAFGYVVVTGELLNITTSPIDGSTPTVGDTIYVKPGGGLTLTKPTGVNFIQNVGLVGKVSGGNAGSLTVSSIMRSNDVPTPLYIDHDNQRLGVGVTNPGDVLVVKGCSPGNIDLVSFQNNAGNQTHRFYTDSANDGVIETVTNAGVTANLIQSSGNSYFNGGNVGIGTTSPGQKLTVNGDVGVTTSNQLFVNDIAAYAGDMIIGPIGASELKFRTAGSERMLIDSSGNVGIGTTSPIVNLEIRGTVNTDDCKIYLTENNTYGAYFKYDGDLNRGYIGGITSTTTENAVLSWSRDGSELKLVTSGSTAVTIDSNRDVTFAEDIIIKEALLSNQKNTDVSGLELVANVLIASYTAAFFDFVIKKGTNVRSGTVYACHDGTNVEFTETSTNDLGDTSDVVLSVDISGTGMRLLADAATSGWSVKSLIRAI